MEYIADISSNGFGMSPSAPENYSHSFRYSYDGNDMLAFESPFYGLIMEKNDLRSLRFKNFDPDGPITYLDCLKEEHRDRMEQGFEDEDLIIELQMDGEIYQGTHAKEEPRLWEAGKICQRYDFRGLDFHGLNLDNFEATLFVVAWPGSVTFQVDVGFGETQTKSQQIYIPNDFILTIKFKDWSTSQSFSTNHQTRNKESSCESNPGPLSEITFNSDSPTKDKIYSTMLSCDFTETKGSILDPEAAVTIEASSNKQHHLLSDFDERFNSFVIRAKKDFLRNFEGGYREIRDYDEIEIKISNNDVTDAYVPLLLFVQPLANPTGVCPIVCDEDYKPTGIPIQLSKNWHIENMNYGRFFTILPGKGHSVTTYRIRLAYGFYGSLPSASHANLWLVGMYTSSKSIDSFSSSLVFASHAPLYSCLRLPWSWVPMGSASYRLLG